MRAFAVALAVAAALALSPSVATADSPGRVVDPGIGPERVVEMLRSADPEKAFAELSPVEKDEVADLLGDSLQSTDEVVRAGALSASEASALGLRPPKDKGSMTAAAATSGCWYHYYYTNWTLYSATVANSWMQLNWCGRSGSISSFSITNVGGTGSGLSYQGNTRSTRNVGWEVRGVTTHRWDFYVGGISKCMQIRGGATGLYSRSVNCSMD